MDALAPDDHPLHRPDPGTAGASARAEFERRHAKREARIEQRWGRFAGVVKALSVDPQHTTAWAQGARGEERLAQSMAKHLDERVIVLHDRKVPGSKGNIDHIAIATSGVWVIDAKNYTGKIEHRNVGGVFRPDLRLFVGGRDRSKAATGLSWQIEAVRAAVGDETVPVSAVLCFTNADWPLFAKPFRVDGVWCIWATKLAELVNGDGVLDDERTVRLAQRLARALPSSHRRDDGASSSPSG